MLYCLVLEDDKERVNRRMELDGKLEGMAKPRRETWGKLPHQQAAMRRAAEAAS